MAVVTGHLFDRIGATYSATRKADVRIVYALERMLAQHRGRIIADIGAGTGNYSCALAERGYVVKAVEPSDAMRRQTGDCPNVEWVGGVAEEIPLDDGSVHGVISTLAIHHFADLKRAFREMARITAGPIVLFTFDPRAGKETWISDYFPTIWDDAFNVFPPIEDIADLLAVTSGRQVVLEPFMVPHDVTDNFAAAGWRNPHLYLDPKNRANMSPFRLADQDVIAEGVARFAEDLRSGKWERERGDILLLQEIDAGYRFVKAAKMT
ncbi:MAG: MerR family transcriptional [Geobacteraceae bacterium]|nr:MAG: MerR family transcriptional [Geobacteraceae bacterium]